VLDYQNQKGNLMKDIKDLKDNKEKNTLNPSIFKKFNKSGFKKM